MITQDLQNWINRQSQKLTKKFGKNKTHSEDIYARTIKLNEEVGELYAEILASDGDVRPDKAHLYTRETLGNEFADVIITTLLIAEKMDININEVLTRKIEKIDDRFKDVKID